ncbi:MAG: sigma-54 dependent transcriptional regulator [Hydrogenophilus sp.]|nr:sigma-54 dependent transcriptional regulator [Hydrogenophilus sp.]
MQPLLFVIDDDTIFRKLLEERLAAMGFATDGAGNWREAEAKLAALEPALIILDYKLPDTTGETALPRLAADYPVIVLTGYGSIRSAVNLVRAGAIDYLTKPVDLADLELAVKRALEWTDLKRANRLYRRQLAHYMRDQIIGESKAISNLRAQIAAVAPTETTVLILGESGTGKELVAAAIHRASPRRDQPFLTLDCTGLTDTLFESELFGHERGSFTGADRQKRGIVEEVGEGTLFLDEIGELPLSQQAKFLRLLENRTFRRVGGVKNLTCHARFIAATHRPLSEMVAEGTFRSDLYYRLTSFVIEVPPLRARRDDIPLLARHLLTRSPRGRGKELSPAAISLLLEYDWPGNVRELANAIERATILAGEAPRLEPDHFAFLSIARRSLPRFTLAFDHFPTLAEAETALLAEAMIRADHRPRELARLLGISERHAYRLLHKTREGVDLSPSLKNKAISSDSLEQ